MLEIILKDLMYGTRLDEVLNETGFSAMLDTPIILPNRFDVTIQGWLDRLDTWGTITYYHKDSESFWGKKKINRSQFIDRVSDESLNKLFGKWETKQNSLTKCTMSRMYLNPSGKKCTEYFIVDIKLRKELQ